MFLPILHHYPESPYAFKVALALRLNGVAFCSRLVPREPPRPATEALTGSYRRIPVLQVGNSVWCDSAVILDEFAAKTSDPLMATAFSAWCDKVLFPATAALLPWESLPDSLLQDRARLMNRDPSKMLENAQKARPHFLTQVIAGLSQLEAHLNQSKTPWLCGQSSPTLCDIHAAMNVFFLRGMKGVGMNGRQVLEGFPAIKKWYALLLDAAGGMKSLVRGSAGVVSEEEVMKIAEDACLRAESICLTPSEDTVLGIKAGDLVTVSPDDYGKVGIVGQVVFISNTKLVIKHDVKSDKPGLWTTLHFPRTGYTASTSDRLVGGILLLISAFVFFYYSTWALILPLFDEANSIHAYFPDRVWAVRIPVILIVVGGSLIVAFIASVLGKSKKKN
ncbi:hypothetical protein HDU78_001489 [Chytriomyces hyalinus]|nr:hypothetical protein HDU78_001489 [Chytriomyces hyalinus]